MGKSLKKESEAETKARTAFMDALAALDPIEISWALNSLAEKAAESIRNHRDNILRLNKFGLDVTTFRPTSEEMPYSSVEKKLEEIERSIVYNKKLIDIALLWREAKNEFELPKLVEYLVARQKGQAK